ncbi:MAG: Rossmann fold nucleotide-binding protein [Marmoricola sp.]|jgi:predicted Rossmann-fold nucleotide-binding protein|nr:Rossmann fold nucleotide-binding protein [Marmoricola sp.]
MTEIESLGQLERAAARARGAGASMRRWQVQGLDLTTHEDALRGLDPRGALFLGCTIPEATADRLRAGGALIFPAVPDVPFDPWRARLYTPAELYEGIESGYEHTPDAQIYAWTRRAATRGSLRNMLAQALHDSSIDDALEEHTRKRRIVGMMGGHALTRDEPAYAEAAHLAHDLAGTGLTVATGGGPGAMEAANLGARLAEHPVDTLDAVLRRIIEVPAYRSGIADWARSAMESTRDLADSGRSLGIPTWHYGHEPPNAFSSVVAKYFRNAVREDVLLDVCTSGIVFLPGAAGTVQEVFQAACTNYYAPVEHVAPMVFVGREYWTQTLPAWPLLSALAVGRPFEPGVHLVDDTSQVHEVLAEDRPSD